MYITYSLFICPYIFVAFRFWYSFKISEVQLRIFRFFFFIVFAIDSFEQLPRTYKITGSTSQQLREGNFNVPHFPLLFSFLPPPSPNLLMSMWIIMFFLSLRVALGISGRFSVFTIALLKGYTILVSQIDNFQHHYLSLLLLLILSTIRWDNVKGLFILLCFSLW